MLPNHIPPHLRNAFQATTLVYDFIRQYQTWAAEQHPDACDFAVGNPHEMPLPAFVKALEKSLTPQDKDWYAYKINEQPAVRNVAGALQQQFGRPFDPADVLLTNGATGALHVLFNALLGPGVEAIYISPPWFFYEGMILNSGGTPVRVRVNPATFDLDLEAIAAAITPRTALIVINSPNNPTGKVYPPETLRGLSRILTEASARNGRPIYLISDEAYRRIIYDGRDYPSPTAYYPDSFMVYTYGKTLLTPGQRLGYIALSPEMAGREGMRAALVTSQVMSGFAITSALLQHALPDLQPLSIDVEHLQYKRDWLVGALREAGYEVHSPEGTFYLLPRSPLADDMAFINRLAEERVYCLAGTIVEMPGYFRVSLTANDEMIARAIPRFRQVARRVS